MNPLALIGLVLGGAAVARAVAAPSKPKARAITAAQAAAIGPIRGVRVVGTVTAAQAAALGPIRGTRLAGTSAGDADDGDDEDGKSKQQQAAEMAAYNAAYNYCEQKFGAGGTECGKFAAWATEHGYEWAEEKLGELGDWTEEKLGELEDWASDKFDSLNPF